MHKLRGGVRALARTRVGKCLALALLSTAAYAATAATPPSTLSRVGEPTPMFLGVCGLVLLLVATVRYKRI